MTVETPAITAPIQIAMILAVCALLIYFGRSDMAAGAYCAIMFWAYNITIGPTTLAWVGFGTLAASAAIYTLRNMLFRRQAVGLTRHDSPMVAWMMLWVAWMFLLYLLFPSAYAELLFKDLLLYGIVAFVAVFLFVADLKRIRAMIVTFMLVTVMTGLVSLISLPAPLPVLLLDSSFQLRGPSGINYLTFAIPFSLSALFALARLLTSTNRLEQAIMALNLAFCSMLVALTGARQSAIGLALGVSIVVIWSLNKRHVSWRLVILIVIIVVAAVVGFAAVTELSNRWASSQLTTDYVVRVEIWSDAWQSFLTSPVWGNGFDFLQDGSQAHNLELDVLASQGLVGLVFMIGYIGLIFRSVRDNRGQIGNLEFAAWRISALAALAYTFVQTGFSGNLAGSPHFFWIAALIWRLGALRLPVNEQQMLPTVQAILPKKLPLSSRKAI